MSENSLEMILNIGESFFTAKKAKELLNMILTGAKQICHAERATLFLVKEDAEQGKEMLVSYVATDIGGELEEIQVPAGVGIVGRTYKTRQAQIVHDVENSPYFMPMIDHMTSFKTRSILSVPLIDTENRPFGVIEVLNKQDGHFDEEDMKKVKMLSLLAVSALGKIEDQEKMQKMKHKINEYKRQTGQHPLVLETNHPGLKMVYEKIKVVSTSNSSVLLTGESGTGKEVMARQIHQQSDRSGGPFIAVNCAAIPKDLFESELFGIKKGTATGVEEREGVFQQANGGTLFFDEIGEMPFELQSKLLRVLQQKTVKRLGDNAQEVEVDFRLVSATNKNLKEAVIDGEFREDLFFRINVFEFQLPPLRDRHQDITALSEVLVKNICMEQNFITKSISGSAFDKLQSYNWPGNIRELKNVLERACVLVQNDSEIDCKDILLPSDPEMNQVTPLKSEGLEAIIDDKEDMTIATRKFQKAYAIKVIKSNGGNKTQAAKELKLSREGLRKILNRDVA